MHKTLTIKKIIIIFLSYIISMFLYFAVFGVKLGNGYQWTCFEPGCVIIKGSYFSVYGNITEFNFDKKYIVGKVGKPNKWLIKHDEGGDPIGYFILNKQHGSKQLGLTKKEFEEDCSEFEISCCNLRKHGVLSFIYDPSYWWKFITI